MKAKPRAQRIADAFGENVARTHRIDIEDIRRRWDCKDHYWQAIRNADEPTFRRILSAIGWEPGSPDYEAFVRAWRALQR